MSKIKNWKKIEDRMIGLIDEREIIYKCLNKRLKSLSFIMIKSNFRRWTVCYARGESYSIDYKEVGIGGQFRRNRYFPLYNLKNKKVALSVARKWMEEHPRGY